MEGQAAEVKLQEIRLVSGFENESNNARRPLSAVGYIKPPATISRSFAEQKQADSKQTAQEYC